MPRREIYSYTTDVTEHLPTFLGVDGEDTDLAMHYGIELECQPNEAARMNHENLEATSTALEAMYDSLEGFVLAKSDSSIGEGGFEIVTTPATMKRQTKEWMKYFSSNGRKFAKSWPTRTCGMHVHMGMDKFTSLQLGKYMMFFNMPINKQFIYQLSGRTEKQLNRWAQTQPATKISNGLYRTQGIGGTRSSAVNITNGKTVEVRIFRGNVQPEGFFKNLQSVEAIYNFCLEVPARKLHHTNFCDWLSDNKHGTDYDQLVEWCKAVGHIGTSAGVKRKLISTYHKGE